MRDSNIGCGGALLVGLAAIAAIVLIYIFGGWLVSVAWNHAMTYVFNLPQIDWTHGIALAYLASHLAGFTGKASEAVNKGIRR